MTAYHVSDRDLFDALEATNKDYSDNIDFRSIKWKANSRGGGSTYQFTLTVKSSKGPGHRTSPSHWRPERKIKAACWHVHGAFFDHLLAINPEAVIESHWGRAKIRITRRGGNWTDLDVGSWMFPSYLSDCCECH